MIAAGRCTGTAISIPQDHTEDGTLAYTATSVEFELTETWSLLHTVLALCVLCTCNILLVFSWWGVQPENAILRV